MLYLTRSCRRISTENPANVTVWPKKMVAYTVQQCGVGRYFVALLRHEQVVLLPGSVHLNVTSSADEALGTEHCMQRVFYW